MRSYEETLGHLFQLRRFGARPGLEVIQTLLAELGDPQTRFPSVHVAGSKGKGSVAAMTASILGHTGRRTGLFTSPHLQSYRERMRIDGRLISRDEVVSGIERIEGLTQELLKEGRLPQPPTFFEVTTALAFDWFAHENVDQAVIEVGLGGRLDSTNVLPAPVGVITSIEYEHTEILGPTLTDIAREKAGILHPGLVAVVGEVPAEAMSEIARAARSRGVGLWRSGTEIRIEARELFEGGQRISVRTPARRIADVEIPLSGTFQATNAALAIAASDRFGASQQFTLSEADIREGLRSVVWRGRLERVSEGPDLFLDVAHTEESARAVARSLAEIYPFTDPKDNVLVFGVLKEKRVDAILDALSPLAETIVLVPVRSDRGVPITDLRRCAVGRFKRVVLADSVASGLSLARAGVDREGLVLVTGSDYLAGEVLDLLTGSEAKEPDLSDPVVVPALKIPASSHATDRGAPR
jgi:dihydrofolate synthase / folylpolyglutamate synthase